MKIVRNFLGNPWNDALLRKEIHIKHLQYLFYSYCYLLNVQSKNRQKHTKDMKLVNWQFDLNYLYEEVYAIYIYFLRYTLQNCIIRVWFNISLVTTIMVEIQEYFSLRRPPSVRRKSYCFIKLTTRVLLWSCQN